jgi:hypothetical protein
MDSVVLGRVEEQRQRIPFWSQGSAGLSFRKSLLKVEEFNFCHKVFMLHIKLSIIIVMTTRTCTSFYLKLRVDIG